MIINFSCKETQKIWKGLLSNKLPNNIQNKALIKLRLIDAAQLVNDLYIPPGNNLEKLKGNRKGQYSIRINDQWRVCFVWQGKDAFDVEIVDYH